MKKLHVLSLTLLWLFSASPLLAVPLKVLFFYPGGQGSQEAAQPLLDGFSEALKKASGDKIEASVTYISDKDAGLKFIQTQKPAAAIVSLDACSQYASAWGATMIAKTLQLPSADGTDQYFIMGKKDASLPGSGKVTVLSSRPFDPNFVAGKLFPQLQGIQIDVQPLRNTIGELRAVGMGEKSEFVLLDQFEYANISRLRAAWVAGLGVAAQSQKVSSAPVLVFPQNLSGVTAQEFLQALVKLGQDSSAQATLQELRMKGFKAAQSPN